MVPPRVHDIRSLASSWALCRGVPVEDILSSAIWKTPNTLLLLLPCYLTDVLRQEGRFGRAAVLGSVRPSRSSSAT